MFLPSKCQLSLMLCSTFQLICYIGGYLVETSPCIERKSMEIDAWEKLRYRNKSIWASW